ncbi:MAG: co-chaperone GroES [Chloroflexi bacterium]|nr:co-chaperone GroES [Chloroflexota bacterium]
MRPLADRVIVQPLEQDEKTASGLLLPETAKEKPQEGLVVAVGVGRWDQDGKKRVDMEVAVGDKIVFAKYSGSEIKLDEKKYLIMSEKDILAVVEK